MKKVIRKTIAVILLAGVLCSVGCGNTVEKADVKDGLRIVTTIFPEYDWVKVISGERASSHDIKMLLDNGTDMHSYQPTVEDMASVSSCDLFIYVGGESDKWAEKAAAEATNKNRIALNLMEILADHVVEEENREGMQAEEEETEEGEEETEYDEHVWLSIENAGIICTAIADSLVKLDPENREEYLSNLEEYKKELDKLYTDYKNVTENARKKVLLFGDRFPFRYLTDEFGLDYYAAFPGCSAETEASFETIIFLAGKADEFNNRVILKIENSDDAIARTIRDNTRDKDQKILVLDSMQATTSKDALAGTSYLSVMRSNLEVLREALDMED